MIKGVILIILGFIVSVVLGVGIGTLFETADEKRRKK